MKPFTRHPRRQGLTYFQHWIFATGIMFRLQASVAAFALHAILPFVSIEPRLDLKATAAFLAERNQFIETSAATAHLRRHWGRRLTAQRDAQFSSQYQRTT